MSKKIITIIFVFCIGHNGIQVMNRRELMI